MKNAMFLLFVGTGAGLIWYARHAPARFPALAVPDEAVLEEFSELSFFPVH
jgi:hypothetical protein